MAPSHSVLIHSYEVERLCLASLIRFPNLFGEIQQFVNEQDFVSKLNKTIFSLIKSSIAREEEVNIYTLAERIKNIHVRFDETDVEPIDYLESLSLLQATEKAAIGFFKDLKQHTVRREISQIGQKLQQMMQNAHDAPVSQIVQMADLLYSEKIGAYQTDNDFVNIYESLQKKIEARGDNPLTEVGFMGPFPKVNELYGSLLRDGAITVIGARTGVGKTALGMYYLNSVAESYDLPILHLDHGEMSMEELQYRAVAMFTGGQITYDMAEKGTWRKNAQLTELMRAIWPRVASLKTYYYDISMLNPKEIISLIRRFYLSKVGRGKKFLTHYDYLKPFDLSNQNTPEWKQMGHFLQDIKSFYKNELSNSFWTSLQLNRFGITGNKTIGQLDDTENTFGVSDRITQQSTHSFLLRYKILEEIGLEGNQLGNAKITCVKHRHLGENVHDAITPVKLPTGIFQKNFVNLHIHNFHIEEKGDLASTVHRLGQLPAHGNSSLDPNRELEDATL